MKPGSVSFPFVRLTILIRSIQINLEIQQREEVREFHNQKAACQIFRHNNPHYTLPNDEDSENDANAPGTSFAILDTIDLHGLYVLEAEAFVNTHIEACIHSRIHKTKVITGKGNHSVGGEAKLLPAILKQLKDMEANDEGLTVRMQEKNAGCIVVVFHNDPTEGM